MQNKMYKIQNSCLFNIFFFFFFFFFLKKIQQKPRKQGTKKEESDSFPKQVRKDQKQ
jgi:preprotein translocase subunit YajC